MPASSIAPWSAKLVKPGAKYSFVAHVSAAS